MLAAALALALPLHFEPSGGAAGSDVRFVAVTGGYSLAASKTGLTLAFSRGDTLEMEFPRAEVCAEERLAGTSNYYPSRGASRWRTEVPQFARIRYRLVFRRTDLVVYGSGGKVEYDWIVNPGGDPSAISFSVRGSSELRIDKNGDLVIPMRGGELRQSRPVISQSVDGVRRTIAGRFIIRRGNEVAFEVGRYDHHHPLVIDPTLVFASGFGGFGYFSVPPYFPVQGGVTQLDDAGVVIGLDRAGNIYVSGSSAGNNFPLVDAAGKVSLPVAATAFRVGGLSRSSARMARRCCIRHMSRTKQVLSARWPWMETETSM